MARLLIIALSYISISAAGVYGADGQATFLPTSRLNDGFLNSDERLANALWSWKEAINSVDRVEALEATSRIESAISYFGPRNFISLADYFISAGRAAIDNDNHEGAVLAGKNAVLFAPNYPAANFFLAGALFRHNKLNINSAIYFVLAGIKAKITNHLERARVVSSHMLFFLLAMAFAFVAFFLIMFLVHYKTLSSDIALRLPFKPGQYVKIAIMALLFILPFIIGGWLLLALVLPLLTWPYLRPAGQVMALLFGMFILLVPICFKLIATGEVIQKDDTYKALSSLSEQTWDHEMISALEQENDRQPDNRLTTFALGNLYHLAGAHEQAIAVYDRLLAADPENVQVMVNRANSFFELKDYESAQEQYNKALEVDSDSVEAHYNLANTYTELFRTQDSNREYQKARSIDPDRTDSFRVALESNPEKKVFGFPITKKDLKQYRSTMSKKIDSLATAFWESYFGATSLNIYYLLALVYIIILLLLSFRQSEMITHQTCSSCGAPFLPPIHVKSLEPKCNQCVATQSAKRVVSTTKKENKRKEIVEYQSRRVQTATILDKVAPGTGRIFFQPTIIGFIITFVTCWFLVYTGVYIYDVALSQNGLLSNYWLPLVVVMAALYWIAMNTILKREFY